MKLGDPTTGLKGIALENVYLEGDRLEDHRRFWDRSAEIDAVRAVADSATEESFATSGVPDRAALEPLMSPDSVVLEIGCGAGRIMMHLARHCRELHGIDLSPAMVEQARKRVAGLPNAQLHVGNGYDLAEFGDDRFDVVYANFVFQHVPKTTVYNYLVEARRVLRPGGLFRFSVPNILRPDHLEEFRFFTQPHFVTEPFPMHFYAPSELCLLLTDTGFVVEELTDYMSVHARKAEPAGLAPGVTELVAGWEGVGRDLAADNAALRSENLVLRNELDRLRSHPVVKAGRRLRRWMRSSRQPDAGRAT